MINKLYELCERTKIIYDQEYAKNCSELGRMKFGDIFLVLGATGRKFINNDSTTYKILFKGIVGYIDVVHEIHEKGTEQALLSNFNEVEEQ